MEDFLIKGVTTAVLNDAGTVPFLKRRVAQISQKRRQEITALLEQPHRKRVQPRLLVWCVMDQLRYISRRDRVKIDESWVTLTSRYWGGGADCVMLRTFSTLILHSSQFAVIFCAANWVKPNASKQRQEIITNQKADCYLKKFCRSLLCDMVCHLLQKLTDGVHGNFAQWRKL